MLLEFGKRLLCRAPLPPPLALMASVVELASLAYTVAKELQDDEDDDE